MAQSSYFSDQWLQHQADLDKRHHTDLLLVPSDGQGVELHSAIILPQSVVLTGLLKTSNDQLPTILFPQVDRDTVLQMVDLLYTGQCLISLSQFYKLNHLLNTLGFTKLLENLSLNACRAQDSHSHGEEMNYELESIQEFEEFLGEDLDYDEVLFIDMILNSDEKCYSFSAHEDEKGFPIKPVIEVEEQSLSLSKTAYSGIASLVGKEWWNSKMGKSRAQVEKNPEGSKVGYRSMSALTLYDCNICGLGFSLEKEMKLHRRVHLGRREAQGKKEAVLECDICGLKMSSKRKLFRHNIMQCVKFGKKIARPTIVNATYAKTPKKEKLTFQRRKLRNEEKQAKGEILRNKHEYQRIAEMKSEFLKTLKNTNSKLMKSLKKTGDESYLYSNVDLNRNQKTEFKEGPGHEILECVTNSSGKVQFLVKSREMSFNGGKVKSRRIVMRPAETVGDAKKSYVKRLVLDRAREQLQFWVEERRLENQELVGQLDNKTVIAEGLYW
eukprot:GFUD01036593.1.p1 GENE.GFUD01036593.1~~GFUD01036593.1.p1  ORF type:complete len:497 (-),score=117.68 GFUD01036593.1:175-1665(-)